MIAATILCRDEADIIEGCIRHAAGYADQIYITDNGSVDGTREIIEGMRREFGLVVWDEPVGAYEQARWLGWMQDQAKEDGAEWILHIDADERYIGDVRGVLENVGEGVGALRVAGRVYVPTAMDDDDDDPVARMRYWDPQNVAHRKMILRVPACRSVLMGNHDADLLPGWNALPCERLRVDHYPDRTFAQFARKYIQGGKAYADSKHPKGVGWHWRAKYEAYQREGMQALHDEWEKIFCRDGFGLERIET